MNRRFSIVFLIALFAFVGGCSGANDQEEVIATVNGESVYLKDLRREISIRVRQNPSLELDRETLLDMADTLIKRQIMIQEAREKKMAEDPGFVDTIKHFWEQTLIRDFIEYKNEQFGRYVFVTDREAQDYYDELKRAGADLPPPDEARQKIRELVEQRKLALQLETWLEREKESADIELNRDVIFEQEI